MTNISAHIEQIARHYWGEPNMKLSQKGRTLRFGNRGSREVHLGKGTWFDFETNEGGGCVDLVRMNEGATISSNIPEILERKFGIQRQAQQSLQPARFMSAVYDYIDDQGEVRYQVRRFEPKTFRQCRPDGKGGWLFNMDGVEALPYNLHHMITNPDAPVFIVEGEKAAQRLTKLGLVATTSHGGAKKWQPVLNQYFAGRNVVVLADNDDAGREHADIVIGNLFGVAKMVKRVELDGLPAKGDVVDWLDGGKGLEDLTAAVKAAPTVVEAPAVEVEAVEVVNDNDGDYFDFVDEDYLMNMPPIEWAVGEGDDGLITAHGLSMIYGPPGSGKSFISLDMALCQAHGIEWQGIETKQGDVLYIAGEGVGGLGKRVKAWKSTHGLGTSGHFHMLPLAVNMRDQAEVEKLIRSIDRLDRKWTAVYIDTLARAMLGADENSSTETGLVISAADAIRNHVQCAVVFVHHSGKAVERGSRGSSAILGAVDTSVVVSKDESYITMRVEKQKDAEPMADLTLEMTPIASISGSSVVLTRLDGGDVPKKKRTLRPASGRQEHAFMALQNVIIDRGEKVVPVSAWHDAHTLKSPDLTKGQKGSDRQALQNKGLVVVHEGKCWINNDLSEKVI
ncbi:MAG: hypothetical protein CMG80_06460 [Marinobacter sp.]|mgnify:FL=1|nr:hypothetical protein [Marinobacter sp.]